MWAFGLPQSFLYVFERVSRSALLSVACPCRERFSYFLMQQRVIKQIGAFEKTSGIESRRNCLSLFSYDFLLGCNMAYGSPPAFASPFENFS